MTDDELEQHEAAALSALTPGEEAAWADFLALARDTREQVGTHGTLGRRSGPFSPSPCFSRFDYQTYDHGRVAPETLARWRAWAETYDALVARHPRLALYDALIDVSEARDCTSFPCGWEDDVRAWVDAGAALPPPFSVDDRIDEAFAGRLRDLRVRAGGWIYWDFDREAVVFREVPVAAPAAWAAHLHEGLRQADAGQFAAPDGVEKSMRGDG